jgi:hypothetical protein
LDHLEQLVPKTKQKTIISINSNVINKHEPCIRIVQSPKQKKISIGFKKQRSVFMRAERRCERDKEEATTVKY